LQDFVETSSNPFDSGKTIIGLGNKRKRSRYQTERERLLDRIDNEKDEDIKKELKQGNEVNIIEDY